MPLTAKQTAPPQSCDGAFHSCLPQAGCAHCGGPSPPAKNIVIDGAIGAGVALPLTVVGPLIGGAIGAGIAALLLPGRPPWLLVAESRHADDAMSLPAHAASQPACDRGLHRENEWKLFWGLLAATLAAMLLRNGVEVVHAQLGLEVLPKRADGLAKFIATKR